MKMEDSPKEEDNLKIEDNLKKRMRKYVDNPEKENYPKNCAGGGVGGPYNFLHCLITCHNIVLKESLIN